MSAYTASLSLSRTGKGPSKISVRDKRHRDFTRSDRQPLPANSSIQICHNLCGASIVKASIVVLTKQCRQMPNSSSK